VGAVYIPCPSLRDEGLNIGRRQPGRAADADHLAERLTLRDRQHDDRRLCLECAALADNRRCLVAARGRLAGADRRFEPVPTIPQRCPGFTLAPGLT
jgi:hypothetical protein